MIHPVKLRAAIRTRPRTVSPHLRTTKFSGPGRDRTRDLSRGRAAEQVPGREFLAYRLGLLQVAPGEKDEREVDLGPAEYATAGLARRLGSRRASRSSASARRAGSEPEGGQRGERAEP